MFYLSGDCAFHQLCSGNDCSARQRVTRTVRHDGDLGLVLRFYYISLFIVFIVLYGTYRTACSIVPARRWLTLWLHGWLVLPLLMMIIVMIVVKQELIILV